jgi:succinate dehydrogenase / fumarate reductase cytochrome b subunit
MLIFHVAKFRFWEYPLSVNQGTHSFYFVRVSLDNGLYTVADRLGVTLYDQAAVEREQALLESRKGEEVLIVLGKDLSETPTLDAHKEVILTSAQKYTQQKAFVQKLAAKPLHSGEVIAVAKDFGTATLLTVRDTFKNPWYAGLYTLFVVAACFHAFNGLWTFMITWGMILKASAQQAAVKWAVGFMLVIAFLGLAAVWGTYWLNLKT